MFVRANGKRFIILKIEYAILRKMTILKFQDATMLKLILSTQGIRKQQTLISDAMPATSQYKNSLLQVAYN